MATFKYDLVFSFHAQSALREHLIYTKHNKDVSNLLLTMSSTPAGTTMGLKESEWGQMGVTMMAGTLGWIIEAPAAAAYAVLPVGVDTIKPGEQREMEAV